MSDDVYRKLADVLDALPNGFPATEDGAEIRLLKRIFSPVRQTRSGLYGVCAYSRSL